MLRRSILVLFCVLILGPAWPTFAGLDPALVGANVTFYFMTVRRSELKKIFDVRERFRGQTIPAEEIVKLKASKVELTLIPRGVGKLDIVAANLFTAVRVSGVPVAEFAKDCVPFLLL